MKSEIIAKNIERKIDKLPQGSTFMALDFIDIGKKTTINRNLLRLSQKGYIRRVGYGIYEKPVYSKMLDEYASTNYYNVAETIARNYNWVIVPSGNSALNKLHLSTQVPNKVEYISNGPYRKFNFGNKEISFKGCSNRNIDNKCYKTLLLIQAIKALKQNNVSKNDIEIIKETYSKKDLDIALKETRKSTNWIHETIKNMVVK